VRRAAPLAALVLLAGCSDDSTVEPGQERKVRLTVSAAASMRAPLSGCAAGFLPARVRLRFAGSDELADQIRRGARPDVYAASDLSTPQELQAQGLLERPVAFIADELVLAVPADGDGDVDGLDGAARPGVALSIASERAPVGASTRDVLRRLDAQRRRAVLANVRSREAGAGEVVAALERGAADAAFLFRTDVEAAEGRLEAIELPDALEPAAAYGAGVVKGTGQPAAAQAFLDDLREGDCHDALLTAGFGEPPP
jgi:molybdate transport system substrate-binding protein